MALRSSVTRRSPGREKSASHCAGSFAMFMGGAGARDVLAPVLAENDRDAGGDIETFDRAGARNRDAQVGRFDQRAAHALAFGAEREREAWRQYRVVERLAVARHGRDEHVAVRAQAVACRGVRARERHDFGGAFGDARGRAGDIELRIPGHDRAGDAEVRRAAQQCAEIVRIADAVEPEQQRRRWRFRLRQEQ